MSAAAYWPVIYVIAMAASGACQAQESRPPLTREGTTMVFQPLTNALPPGRVKLANGTLVDRRDWTTLILAGRDLGDDKRGTCTGTLVGPNAVLLAAHCVDRHDGVVRPTQLWIDSRRIEMRCEIHPAYAQRNYLPSPSVRGSEDFALCLLKDGGKRPASFSNLQFEVVDAQSPVQAGDVVLMSGYGCSAVTLDKEGYSDSKSDIGVLRIGNERIETPAGKWTLEPAYATIRSKEGKEPALCLGDSGGPLFSGADPSRPLTHTNPNAARRIRGVNSSVCTARRNESTLCATDYGPGKWDIISAISATGFKDFKPWALDWIRRNDHQPVVCGINRAAGEKPCRD